MDWLTFTTRIVEALAWPGVAVYALWLLQQPLTQLLGRVRRLKWKDAEADFAELLTEAKRDAEKANLPQPEIKRLTAAQPPEDPIERLHAIASISPKAAVFAA